MVLAHAHLILKEKARKINELATMLSQNLPIYVLRVGCLYLMKGIKDNPHYPTSMYLGIMVHHPLCPSLHH